MLHLPLHNRTIVLAADSTLEQKSSSYTLPVTAVRCALRKLTLLYNFSMIAL
jgi:hypothetical protein